MKTFYKVKNDIKTFYVRVVSLRTSAYGNEIVSDYVKWRRDYNEKRSLSGNKYLSIAQGDVGNNNQIRMNIKKYLTSVREVSVQECYLPALWLNNLKFTVSRDGYLLLNGEKRCYLGQDLKGWGIISEAKLIKTIYYLAVIGTTNGQCRLSIYSLDIQYDGAITAVEQTAFSELAVTQYAQSTVLCLGRNIILIHNDKLEYFYFEPIHMRLEPVITAADGILAQDRVVVGDDGTVFWIDGEGTCVKYFKLGHPDRRYAVGELGAYRVYDIQSYNNRLYVYYRAKANNVENLCVVYEELIQDKWKSKVFNKGARFNLMLSEIDGKLRYVKICDGKAIETVRDTANDTECAEYDHIMENSGCERCVINAFSCADNVLYIGRYDAGYDQ